MNCIPYNSGYLDRSDNCPTVAQTSQDNSDGDDVGDAVMPFNYVLVFIMQVIWMGQLSTHCSNQSE